MADDYTADEGFDYNTEPSLLVPNKKRSINAPVPQDEAATVAARQAGLFGKLSVGDGKPPAPELQRVAPGLLDAMGLGQQSSIGQSAGLRARLMADYERQLEDARQANISARSQAWIPVARHIAATKAAMAQAQVENTRRALETLEQGDNRAALTQAQLGRYGAENEHLAAQTQEARARSYRPFGGAVVDQERNVHQSYFTPEGPKVFDTGVKADLKASEEARGAGHFELDPETNERVWVSDHAKFGASGGRIYDKGTGAVSSEPPPKPTSGKGGAASGKLDPAVAAKQKSLESDVKAAEKELERAKAFAARNPNDDAAQGAVSDANIAVNRARRARNTFIGGMQPQASHGAAPAGKPPTDPLGIRR